MSEITTVTRKRRDNRGVQDTTYRTDCVSGEIRHHTGTFGEYVSVSVHANQGEWYNTPAVAAEVHARYLAESKAVSVNVGYDAHVFMSVDQATALAASLAEALNKASLGN